MQWEETSDQGLTRRQEDADNVLWLTRSSRQFIENWVERGNHACERCAVSDFSNARKLSISPESGFFSACAEHLKILTAKGAFWSKPCSFQLSLHCAEKHLSAQVITFSWGRSYEDINIYSWSSEDSLFCCTELFAFQKFTIIHHIHITKISLCTKDR